MCRTHGFLITEGGEATFFFFCTEKTNQTVKLDASTVEIEERGVKLRLTVVDTPGYGDSIDNTDR